MRTFDPSVPNRIANMPEVACLIGGKEIVFDFSDAIADHRNIFLHDGDGVGMFIWSAPRVYEWHLVFSPACRGRAAITATENMRNFMMPEHADMLWARAPMANKAVRWLARQIGMSHIEFSDNKIVGPVEILSCRRF